MKRESLADCRIRWETGELEEILEKRGYAAPVRVGTGACADVYRVQAVSQGKFLACKVAKSGPQPGREADFMRSAGHPLFPGLKDFWEEDGVAFLVMEYFAGSSLEAMLDRRGRMGAGRAVRIALELSDGLQALHERREPVFFRDVKPGNILICQDGRVKLIDLGCACHVWEKSLAGTPGYAAPEQLIGANYDTKHEINPAKLALSEVTGLTPAADVYGLGKVLYHMLTGQNPCLPPHRAQDVRSFCRELSRELAGVVRDCTQEEQKLRLPDMRALRRALLGCPEAREGKGRGILSRRMAVPCQVEKSVWLAGE